MNAEIVIRRATGDDIPAILDIYNDAILNTAAVYDYEPHTLEMRKQWFDAKQRDGLPVLVAELQNTVAGFASFGPFRPWAAYKYTVEHSVYVNPSFRQKGIGTLLLRSIMESARSQNIHVMVAGIDAENKVSIDMHRKLGFSEAGTIRQVAWKFEKWRDLLFMQYCFSAQVNQTEGQQK